MKLTTAFKLSALAVALASTSVMAATLDTSELGNDVWTDPRAPQVGNVDQTAYQYVDVGSGNTAQFPTTKVEGTDLTSWYTVEMADGSLKEIIKIEQQSGAGEKTYKFFDVTGVSDTISGDPVTKQKWLNGIKQNIDQLPSLASVDFTNELNALNAAGLNLTAEQYLKILTTPETQLLNEFDATVIAAAKDYYFNQLNALKDGDLVPTNLGGVTGNSIRTESDLSLVKRLDSTYLEYAEQSSTTVETTKNFGNLTDKDVTNPQVWLTIDTDPSTREATVYDRGVINGIINTDKKGHLAPSDKYVKHFKDLYSTDAVTPNVYGLVASEVKTVTKENLETGAISTDVEIDRYTAVTQAGVVVSDEIKGTQTIIASDNISTGSLTVGGIDVGTALGNVAALGNLNKDQLDAIVNGGQKISALETGLSDLDTKVDTEVARLDGRIDAELTANATASTAYTDQKATETLAAANTYTDTTATTLRGEFAAGDAATLATARTEIAAGDAATLTAANAYTDQAVQGFNSRVNQLNQRVNDVEKTAYRGIAIALAAQQQIPNIGAGQMAVFGGVGHYEGESAAALGLASVLADGRTSVSAALGFAGGSEIGGRVGVAYVFGGK